MWHFLIDCLCTNQNLKVISDCISVEAQPLSMGEYEIVCSASANNIYSHTDSSSMSLLHYLKKEEKWVISSILGSNLVYMATTSQKLCQQSSANHINWQTFIGEVRTKEALPFLAETFDILAWFQLQKLFWIISKKS